MVSGAYVSILQLLLYHSHTGAIFFYSETTNYDKIVESLKSNLPEVCLFNLSETSSGPLLAAAHELNTIVSLLRVVILDFSADSYNLSVPVRLALEKLSTAIVYKFFENDCDSLERPSNNSDLSAEHWEMILCQEKVSPNLTYDSFQLSATGKTFELIYNQSMTDNCGPIGFNTLRIDLKDFLNWLRDTHDTYSCQNSCRGRRQHSHRYLRQNYLVEACSSCYTCIGCDSFTSSTCFTNQCPTFMEDEQLKLEHSRVRSSNTFRLIVGLISETMVVIICALYFRKHGLTSYKNAHLHIKVISMFVIFSTTIMGPLDLIPIISIIYCGLNTVMYHFMAPATILDTPHLALTDLRASGRLTKNESRIILSNYALAVFFSFIELDERFTTDCLAWEGYLLYLQLYYGTICSAYFYMKRRQYIEHLRSKVTFTLANFLAVLVSLYDWSCVDSRAVQGQKFSSVLMILSTCGNFLVRSSNSTTKSTDSDKSHRSPQTKLPETISFVVSSQQQQQVQNEQHRCPLDHPPFGNETQRSSVVSHSEFNELACKMQEEPSLAN